MRLTAADQLALGVVDEVVAEPGEGAHSDPQETARRLSAAIVARLEGLARRPVEDLVEARYARYRAMGAFATLELPAPVRVERPGFSQRLRGLLEGARSSLVGPPGTALRPQAADEIDEPPLRGEL